MRCMGGFLLFAGRLNSFIALPSKLNLLMVRRCLSSTAWPCAGDLAEEKMTFKRSPLDECA